MNARLAEALAFLFPSARPLVDYLVQDDGAGPYLKEWHLPGSPPTDAEINAAVAQIPAAQLAAKQVAAKAVLDDDIALGRVQRAVIKMLVAELNILRAVAGLPARTALQVTTAIKTAIDQEN